MPYNKLSFCAFFHYKKIDALALQDAGHGFVRCDCALKKSPEKCTFNKVTQWKSLYNCTLFLLPSREARAVQGARLSDPFAPFTARPAHQRRDWSPVSLKPSGDRQRNSDLTAKLILWKKSHLQSLGGHVRVHLEISKDPRSVRVGNEQSRCGLRQWRPEPDPRLQLSHDARHEAVRVGGPAQSASRTQIQERDVSGCRSRAREERGAHPQADERVYGVGERWAQEARAAKPGSP